MSAITYKKLIELLDQNNAQYRLMDHESEWRSEIISKIRWNELKQAANCIILMVKIGKKDKKFVLSVYPADKRLNLNAVKDIYGGSYVSFADKEKAEELAGSVLWTVLPFTFHEELELLVDPLLLENETIFFNAARLDQSVALQTSDYIKIAQPRLESIVQWSEVKDKSTQASEKMIDSWLSTKRHSLSHIMSQAIAATFPDITILRGVGPAIDNGFYQDYDFGDFELKEEHLKEIEKKMKHILKQNQLFVQSFLTLAEARVKFGNDPYKMELINELAKNGETQFGVYTNTLQNGTETYVDLCAGPHVAKTSELDENSFKLERVAGAYWRGDEKNKMLTRVYGISFETKEELDVYLMQQEEAKKRDHKKLWRKLGLFSFSELVGPGLPLWSPRGTILRDLLNNYVMDLRSRFGYQKVSIPHITKKDLYEKSGHWDKYKDDLFKIETREKHIFVMKPMNCPHHAQIFDSEMRSYRDMPQRYCETTAVYRDEQSGELSWLSRVLCITQDDAHVFCRLNQINDEVENVWNIISEFYATFGFTEIQPRLSRRDMNNLEKYLGESQNWDFAEETLKNVILNHGDSFIDGPGEAAFYGPKIDFMAQDAIGRKHQVATIQIDFVQPKRFELGYTNEKGEKDDVVMLHVAIMGSIERFLSVMIEHFAGIFPLWLAPRQAIVVPVGEKFNDYAEKVLKSLRDAGIRAEGDFSTDGLNKKVRNAEQAHINYIIVVGEKEEANNGVAVRNYKTKEQTEESARDFIERIKNEIEKKTL